MNPDGSNIKRLTNNTRDDQDTAVSPDGTKIVFSRQEGSPLRFHLYVMNSDGSNQVRITNGNFNDTDPEWNPDASKLALEGLAKSATLDYGERGIRVNIVAPGTIDTPMVRKTLGVLEDEEGWAVAREAWIRDHLPGMLVGAEHDWSADMLLRRSFGLAHPAYEFR